MGQKALLKESMHFCDSVCGKSRKTHQVSLVIILVIVSNMEISDITVL